MAVLLTRPRADSERIASELGQISREIMIWPLTRIVPVPGEIEIPARTDAVAFSSGHAVRAFADRSNRRDLTAFCVGTRTAELARASGFTTVSVADGQQSSLTELILSARPREVLYARGADISGDLQGELIAGDLSCNSMVLYRAVPQPDPPKPVDKALSAGKVAVLTIWSQRNATLFGQLLGIRHDWNICDTTLVGISENALSCLAATGFRRIIVASRPNATQMIAEIRAALQ